VKGALKERIGQKRPWLAAALSLVYPGLGHVYLREWLRGLLWFGLVLATVSVLLPASALPPADGGFSFDAVMQATQALPEGATLALFGVIGLSVLDAYRLAAVGNRRAEVSTGRRCPSCSRELEADLDLDFCHWCTARLDDR
jgi:hypothetical protein